MHTRFWLENLREGDNLENLDADNIKVDLPEVGWGHGPDWSGSEMEQVDGSCEWDNEPSDYTKCGDFLD